MTTITHLPQLPLEPAPPRSFRSLTLVPLFPRDEPSLDYVGLTEALADGLLVMEVDEGGDVQTLLVENPLETLVLLYEGAELVGAKQTASSTGRSSPARARACRCPCRAWSLDAARLLTTGRATRAFVQNRTRACARRV